MSRPVYSRRGVCQRYRPPASPVHTRHRCAVNNFGAVRFCRMAAGVLHTVCTHGKASPLARVLRGHPPRLNEAE